MTHNVISVTRKSDIWCILSGVGGAGSGVAPLSSLAFQVEGQGLTAPPRHPPLPGRGLTRNRRTRGLRASRPFSSYAVDKAKWPNLTTCDSSYCCYFFPLTS